MTKLPEKCSGCGQYPREGCSRVVCPSRRIITANTHEGVESSVYGGILRHGSPRLSDEEYNQADFLGD